MTHIVFSHRITTSGCNYKKRKDSLEAWAVLLIIVPEVEFSGVAENDGFFEELFSKNEFEAVPRSIVMTMVPTVLR